MEFLKRSSVFILFMLLAAGTLWAPIDQPLNIQETDGSPSTYPYKLLVSTGTLTDNGDGTATLTTGGGGGSGSGLTYLHDSSSNTISSADIEYNSSSIGPVLRDSANCLWRTTVNTSGVLSATLLSCPSVIVSRPCTTGMSLGILLSVTCP